MQQFELTPDQVTLVSRSIALGEDTLYQGGVLIVRDAAIATAVAAMLDDENWEVAAGKASLIAYAAIKRWQVETGGITVAGAAIDTSRESQAMITGAYAYSQANPSETISYKAISGWVTIDAATMTAIATAVGAHVQACFAAEASAAAEIEAGTITTTAEIDAADWPA